MYTKNTTYIILDACRYDYFEQVYKDSRIYGTLTKVNTRVSTTAQWYNKYWNTATEFYLLSQNPMPFHNATNKAHNNFKYSKASFGRTWLDIDVENTLKELAVIYGESDNWIVHLLPPHLPFVAKEAKPLMKKLRNRGKNIYWETQIWGQNNNFDVLIDFYKKSILDTLQKIKDVLYLFENKKVVITSDHGELIGEDKYYDHITAPNKKLRPYLYEVPWLEVNVEETLLEERMAMLGYM